MADRTWTLQRGYASVIFPTKGKKDPPPPSTYALKLDSELRHAVVSATSEASRRSLSEIVLKMTENREHPLRELLITISFGQTRAPMPAMTELASRLSQCTDGRTGSSLLVATVEETGDSRRITLYVFPEEDTYALRSLGQQETEAFLERMRTFVLKSRLRKVAQFEGKNIRSHFLRGRVLDLQIGNDPRTAADYWLTAFLDAEFAINSNKGTDLVAAGLRRAFAKADPDGKQSVMEAATALVAHGRQAWSMEKIARELVPRELHDAFFSVAKSPDALTERFLLNRKLLRERINYRVFQLKNGVWVSSPFHEVGKSVRVQRNKGQRILTAHGVVLTEKVQRDAKRSASDKG